MTLLEAIARYEGFYVTGSRPNRNNNPGDLEWGRFARAHGATRAETAPSPRFAYFPDAVKGFGAMKALFQTPSYKGLSVRQAINRYAPSDENDTDKYVACVCHWVGCKETDVIDGLVQP